MKRLAATLSLLLSLVAMTAFKAMPDDAARTLLMSIGAATICSLASASLIWFVYTFGGANR